MGYKLTIKTADTLLLKSKINILKQKLIQHSGMKESDIVTTKTIDGHGNKIIEIYVIKDGSD